MRLALYSLLFLGTVLLVLDLKKKVSLIPTPEKPKPTQAAVPAKSAPSATQPMPQGHPNPGGPDGHPDIKQALAQYTKAIEAAPNKASSYIDRANAYIANRQFTEALADFDKALAIEPENTSYRLHQGTVYLNLKQDDKAILSFTQAIEINPEITKPLIYRAITHFRNDHFQPALDDCLLILKKDPKFTDLHITIAQCYKGIDQNDKALEHLAIYLETTTDPKGKQQAKELKKLWDTPK